MSYLDDRRRPLRHRHDDCPGAWEVTYVPVRSERDDEIGDLQLVCRTCAGYYRVQARTDADDDYRCDRTAYRTSWHSDDEPLPRPAAEHRPRLEAHPGPLAHIVETVQPIRAHGFVLTAVDWLRIGGPEAVLRWEVREQAARAGDDPVALIVRDRGPRGGERWAYVRLAHVGAGAPGAGGYGTPRAAAKGLAARLAQDRGAAEPAIDQPGARGGAS